MSRLLENSEQFRNPLISKNEYTNNDEYEAGNPNALSDGDEKGKGEFNGSIGSSTDISKRNELEAKNIYNKNREYNIDVA